MNYHVRDQICHNLLIFYLIYYPHFFLLFSVDYFITYMFKHKTALNRRKKNHCANNHRSMQKSPAEMQVLQHYEYFFVPRMSSTCDGSIFLVSILLPLLLIQKTFTLYCIVYLKVEKDHIL